MEFASLVYFYFMNTIIQHISELLKETIKGYKPISGGDISQALFIETSHNRYFLKANNKPDALQMFKTEAFGLKTIRNTQTISVPEVFYSGKVEDNAFILLEFIESKPASNDDFERLGQQLAKMHQITSEAFGFSDDNFIGSLTQSNRSHDSWIDFYINERLYPQFELALFKGLLRSTESPSQQCIKSSLLDLMKGITPSLLHGDLWGGNFLISNDGNPYLIDPAVYYGHHEVDIAMSKLFGGFGSSFYRTYHEVFPKTPETITRIEIYQLYYLLVHLNIFGSSYYSSVKKILDTYFN